MQQVSCSIAGKHGRYINMQADVAPSAEDCAAQAEEQKMIGKDFYLARKEDIARRYDCAKCNRIHCPEQVHMTGHLGKKRLDTRRGNGNDFCIGCG
jgi:Pyruvate/2-oxoacid:ferredoxin oxidoreductase delta subunit